MTNSEIVENIEKAVKGDLEATFILIIQYENLIEKNCKINGKLNLECRDFVIEKLIKDIKKFRNVKKIRKFKKINKFKKIKKF